jgi:hypothetical protein
VLKMERLAIPIPKLSIPLSGVLGDGG